MKILESDITAPRGFTATATSVNLNGSDSGKEDMMLVLSEVPAVAAGVFTKNSVKSGTVLYCMDNIKSETSRAFLGISGVANACVPNAYEKAEKVCDMAAKLLKIKSTEILPACTGKIGKEIDFSLIEKGFEQMPELGRDNSKGVSRSIMTSDSYPKTLTVESYFDEHTVLLSCIGKGSGMIHPNMGTTINFATTDISITKELLQEALVEAVDETFNMISIDGDMSTNDTFLIMSSGLAGNKTITEKNSDYYKFLKLLTDSLRIMARMIASDGEGASKLLVCTLVGAKTKEDARTLAKAVIASTRYKAAMNGLDAYGARILANMGYTNKEFDFMKTKISYKWKDQEAIMYENGVSYALNFDQMISMANTEEVEIYVNINNGEHSAQAYGCDLSCDYIKEVTNYR